MTRGAADNFITKKPEKPRTHDFTSACICIKTIGKKFRTVLFLN